MNINNQGQPLQASLSSISPVAGRQGYGVLSNNDQNPQVHLAVQSLSQAAPGYQNFSQSYTESGPYAQYPQSHAAQVNPTASYAMRAAILAEAQHLPLDVCGSCQEISHLSGSPSANINGYGQSNSIQPQSSLASSLGLGFSHHPNYAACRTGNSISPQTAYSTAPQGGAGPQHPMPSQPQVASSPSSHGRQEQNSITGNKYHKQQEPQGYWDLPSPSTPVNPYSQGGNIRNLQAVSLNRDRNINKSSLDYSQAQVVLVQGGNTQTAQHRIVDNDQVIASMKCEVCGIVFHGQYCSRNLGRHMQSKHPQPGTNKLTFPCEACDRTYQRADALLHHQRRHHPELEIAPPTPRKRSSESHRNGGSPGSSAGNLGRTEASPDSGD